MGAVLRNSTLYQNYVNKYPVDARLGGGRVVPIPFEFTVVSPSTVGDTYNLCVLPAYCRVVGLDVNTDGLGASAGAGRNLQIGDAGNAQRYLASLDADVANSPGALAMAGAGYQPTVDTVVVATSAGGAWSVGKKVVGCFYVVPAA